MKRDIITTLPELRKTNEEVSPEEIESIFTDLEDSLKGTSGVGLSANQIGINKRVAIIRFEDFKFDMYNPQMVERMSPTSMIEGCLSLPGIEVKTKRYLRIKLQNGDGQIHEFEGVNAIIVQHEYAHLMGRTILDDKWRS